MTVCITECLGDRLYDRVSCDSLYKECLGDRLCDRVPW